MALKEACRANTASKEFNPSIVAFPLFVRNSLPQILALFTALNHAN
jgi:hypothetical protein